MSGARWRWLALVVAGGALGTLAREGLVAALPGGEVPWAILVANLAGAFAIGLLLEGLAGLATDGVPHRGWRLFLVTGFLGGLTTYSALAVGTDALLRGGRPALGVAYGVGTVVAGLVACWLGLAAAAWGVRVARRRPPRDAAGVES